MQNEKLIEIRREILKRARDYEKANWGADWATADGLKQAAELIRLEMEKETKENEKLRNDLAGIRDGERIALASLSSGELKRLEDLWAERRAFVNAQTSTDAGSTKRPQSR